MRSSRLLSSALAVSLVLTLSPSAFAARRPSHRVMPATFEDLPARSSSSPSSSSASPEAGLFLTRRALRRQMRLEWTARDASVALPRSSASSSSSSSLQGGLHRYEEYREGVLGTGQETLLYFYAPWTRQCQGVDKMLRQWSEKLPFLIPLYRVDFDDSGDLRTRYGVVYENTYVLVDRTGEKKELLRNPHPSKLETILYNR